MMIIGTFAFIKREEIRDKVSYYINQRVNLGTNSSKTIKVSELGNYSGTSGDRGVHALSIGDGSNAFCADINKQIVTSSPWKTTSYENLYAIDMRNTRYTI